MAKKSYVSLRGYNCKAESYRADEAKMTFNGSNSKGTMGEVTIIVDDYMLPHILDEMKKIVDKRVADAHALQRRFARAFDPGF